jgi:hypothetical protein
VFLTGKYNSGTHMGLTVGHYLGEDELPFGPKTIGINGVGNITLRDFPKLDEKAFTLAVDGYSLHCYFGFLFIYFTLTFTSSIRSIVLVGHPVLSMYIWCAYPDISSETFYRVICTFPSFLFRVHLSLSFSFLCHCTLFASKLLLDHYVFFFLT